MDDKFYNKENEINNEGFSFEDDGFEDIMSDSHYYGGGTKRYRKKKHGISGFFQKIGDWWNARKRWQKRTIISVASVLLVIAVAFGAFRIIFNYNYNDITKDPDDLGFKNVIDSKIVNVALFGIDSRDPKSFKGLSDSIMILSINTETKVIKVISVMRDSLVPITKDGKTVYGKINSAYSKGGPELAIKTLNTIFGLDISEYATVNFYGMTDIIDAVGGIDVTLADGEINVMGRENGKSVNFGINGMIMEQCGYMGIDPTPYFISSAGEHHLNGVQAVAYARIRHAANVEGTNNDQGRTDRQRYVMEQLFNKATTLSAKKYVKLAKALIPCSETSLSYTEIMGLATNVLLKSPKFEQTRVPLDKYQMPSKTVSGYGSCIYYDLDYASKIIHAFIYDDIKPENYIEQNGVEKNDWYAKRGSSGGSTSSSVQSSSQSVTPSSTAPSSSSSDITPSVSSSEPSSSPSSEAPSSNSSSSEPSTSSEDNSSADTSSDNTSTDIPDGTEE